MQSLSFLTLAEVLEIHRDQIQRYGGAPGIRDMGLLRSALAMPSAGFGDSYAHEDLCAMAAAYLFHISRNHPFVDGNKRVATVSALVFLALNGVEVEIADADLEAAVVAVAAGEWDKVTVATFLRQRVVRP